MRSDHPILVVEDDLLDSKNIRRSFKENRVLNPLYFVKDGEQALAYLKNEPPFEDVSRAPRPGVILLDLNLPRMNGLAFLQAYKSVPKFCTIPTVVLTTSKEQSDLLRTYQVGIAGYIVKPMVFNDFIEVVRRFDLYWAMCEIPRYDT